GERRALRHRQDERATRARRLARDRLDEGFRVALRRDVAERAAREARPTGLRPRTVRPDTYLVPRARERTHTRHGLILVPVEYEHSHAITGTTAHAPSGARRGAASRADASTCATRASTSSKRRLMTDQ